MRKASSKLGYRISSFKQVRWHRDSPSLLGQTRVPGNYITASAPACSKSFQQLWLQGEGKKELERDLMGAEGTDT